MARSEDQLRKAVKRARQTVSLRELAARIGVSHYALHKVEKGKSVRATTLARIAAWLDEPGENDVAERLRTDLKRLVGRLGIDRAREIEGAIGEVIGKAFEQAGHEVPRWVHRFGARQV